MGLVSQSYGGHSGRETPGPIPNPEAKPASADGTALVRVWESRSPPNTTSHESPESPSPVTRGSRHCTHTRPAHTRPAHTRPAHTRPARTRPTRPSGQPTAGGTHHPTRQRRTPQLLHTHDLTTGTRQRHPPIRILIRRPRNIHRPPLIAGCRGSSPTGGVACCGDLGRWTLLK